MLISIGLILICGYVLSQITKRLKLPEVVGMIFAGIILGPYVLNLISKDVLNISSDLRQIALIVILLRAGLSLDIKKLKQVGRPALLMCFVPALFELVAITVLAPILFDISYLHSAILGSVLAAVSPAVVVPRMIKLTEQSYGTKKGIPQLITAASSVDDVFVLVLFASFMDMEQGKGFNALSLLNVPISIFLGAVAGILIGLAIIYLSKKFLKDKTVTVIIILALSILMLGLESIINKYVPFSALLATISLGAVILKKNKNLANDLSKSYSKIWIAAQIILFVLLGAAVDINHVKTAGLAVVGLILIALVFRTIGVFVCMIKSNLNFKERLFCAISYLPKATVQAAIGGLPLAAGLSSGSLILTISALSILITAPLGAVLIDASYKKLLEKGD